MTSSIFSTRTARRTVTDRLVQVTTRSAATIVATAIARSLRTDTRAPIASARPAPVLSVIDDPEGRVRLIGVRGTVDYTMVADLAAAVEARLDIEHVHIDFSAADIAPERTIECLETMFDQAERRGLRLRVVGLDPEHPALRRRTSR